jgi:nitrogen fixation NifU-like protein
MEIDSKEGTNNFDFWQDHSTHYLEMALGCDRCEVIKHPDGYGKRTGDCGDTVTELAEGRKVKDAWAITPDDVVAYLQTLPAENPLCRCKIISMIRRNQ